MSEFMNSGIPLYWGPGPWDDEPLSWEQKATSSGDLRRWREGDPLSGGRLIPHAAVYPTLTGGVAPGGYGPRAQGAGLLTTCWCGRTNTTVPAHWVREGRTRICRAPECWTRWQLEKLRPERS